MTAFALRLGASEVQIGLLGATTPLASVAQLAGSWAIERTGRRKRICMIASWISRLLWVPILLVPLVCAGTSPHRQIWYITALLIASSLFGAIGGHAWLSWIKELVPNEIRLRFLGRRHVFNTALAFGMSVAGGLFVDAWLRWRPDSLGGFLTVFATAMTCGIIGLLILNTIPDAAGPPPVEIPLRRLVKAPLKDRNFRRLIAFYGVWNFASNLATPFFAVYMLVVLQLSFATVTMLLTFSSVLGLAATRLWTRFGDRFGTRNMVLVATMADVACPLAWLLVSPSTLYLLIPVHMLGVFAAPITLGPNALSLKLSPSANGSGHLALFCAITGPLTAVGAVVGGTIAGWSALEGTTATIAGLRLVFVLSAVGRFASLFILRGVRERESQPVRRVVRVLHRVGRRWNRDRRRPALQENLPKAA